MNRIQNVIVFEYGAAVLLSGASAVSAVRLRHRSITVLRHTHTHTRGSYIAIINDKDNANILHALLSNNYLTDLNKSNTNPLYTFLKYDILFQTPLTFNNDT